MSLQGGVSLDDTYMHLYTKTADAVLSQNKKAAQGLQPGVAHKFVNLILRYRVALVLVVNGKQCHAAGVLVHLDRVRYHARPAALALAFVGYRHAHLAHAAPKVGTNVGVGAQLRNEIVNVLLKRAVHLR